MMAIVYMSRKQVLDWDGWTEVEWPTAGKNARHAAGKRWGSTNWFWGLSGYNDEAVLFSDLDGYVSHCDIASQQGDPNAHESVSDAERFKSLAMGAQKAFKSAAEVKVTMSGDASGAEVKRAVEGAVKASTKPDEWDGESTPAVGLAVEYRGPNGFEKANVIGVSIIDPTSIVVEFHDGGIDVTEIGCLRPIRSEREKAVEEMVAVTDEHLTPEDTCRALYDAGYRKTEGA